MRLWRDEMGLYAWLRLGVSMLMWAAQNPAADDGSIFEPCSRSARFVVPVIPIAAALSHDEAAARVAWHGGCPLRLTALVCSEQAAQSLAVVRVDGRVEVLRVGQTVVAQAKRFVVTGILPEFLMLKHAAQQTRCGLRDDLSR